ncbi:hypothetical protein CF70_013040 [Cupriavidus sp. SK-3]|uniref:hypothetical protein n=1 Tax=Cupriavidus sp. SK-3 TaxID=1470558 RepID=UPI0004462E85|nr:hypothetical protein [Cupriavidus sp. SK-3]KDP85616.1 hypothetical protein CF70_013040 [Cupriavidus sp. SK-3]
MAGSHNTARIIGVMGASGSGKSRWLKGTLARGNPAKLLIWDPLNEYEQGRIITDLRELVETLGALEPGDPFKLTYRPGPDMSTYAKKFDTFCALAFVIEGVCVVIEELADVTSPSWAPPAWSRLSRQGRHKGMTIFAASQRPTLMDKTFLGNCTMIHCSRLNDENDVKTMRRYLGVSEEQVRGMVADKDSGRFDFIERDMQTGKTVVGRLG